MFAPAVLPTSQPAMARDPVSGSIPVDFNAQLDFHSRLPYTLLQAPRPAVTVRHTPEVLTVTIQVPSLPPDFRLSLNLFTIGRLDI